jgi:PPM family protein phosphatase
MLTRASAAWSTHTGKRHGNQDAALAEVLPDGRELVAVADGMGGHAGGEIASRLALDVLHGALRDGLDLRAAVLAANDAVYARAMAEPELEGMGTTLVVLLRRGGRYEIANVGDSRAYRLNGRGLEQLTLDHSFMAEAERNGMSADEIARSPWRSALMRAIGTDPDVEPDLFGPFEVSEPHAVLLCSDGLYGVVAAPVIVEQFLKAASIEAATQALVEYAAAAGSRDNITAAAMEFGAMRAAAASFGDPVAAVLAAGTAAGTHPPPGLEAEASSPPAEPDEPVEPGATIHAPRTAMKRPSARKRRHRRIRWDNLVFGLCVAGLLLWLIHVLTTL